MKTSLYSKHIELRAKMVDFAGYKMPIQYPQGINLESKSVRQSVGLFDVSHMGQIYIKGENSLDFVNYITTNNVSKLSPGQCQYTLLCNDRGGIIDDLILYCLDDGYMLVVNAANIENDFNWIKQHKPKNITIEDLSKNISLIALQGPKSRYILSKFPELRECLTDLKFYKFSNIKNKGMFDVISRTGYTGELGFEIYSDHEFINYMWDKLISDYSVSAVGLAARDILRLEMCYLLYGNDMNENITPYNCGLHWVVDLDKPNFIGRSELINEKNSTDKKIVSFLVKDKCIPRKGYSLFCGDKEVGYVTSGTFSPNLASGIGMGYIQNKFIKKDNFHLRIRDRKFSINVFKGPFIKENSLFE